MVNDTTWMLRFAVTPGEVAPETDWEFYRNTQLDLQGFNEGQLATHYQEWGRGEGRMASPAAHRTAFIAQILTDSVLEIGPAVRPSLIGPGVKYFDIEDRAGLIAKAIAHEYPTDNAVDIDFISPTGNLSVVDEQFDSVFSSHCIEHQPDLARHLIAVEKILRPGGRYFLIVPDKRYTFDATLDVSTLEDVLEAYQAQRVLHTTKSIMDHYIHTTHNDAARHWAGDSADPRIDKIDERRNAAEIAISLADGGYVDCHGWLFTPETFRSILEGLYDRTIINLEVERVYDTVRGMPEFCAVIRKP